METAVVWLLVIGPLFIGIGAAIYWGSGSKLIGLWVGFVPGAIVLVIAAALQTQIVISKTENSETPPANETEIKRARAYVFIDTAEVIFDGSKSNAILNFKNFGTTPAYDVVGWIKTGIRNPDDPIILNPMPRVAVENRDSKVTVGPQGTFRLSQAADFNNMLPKEEVKKLLTRLEKGESLFIATGDVVYRDTFDRRWELTFQLRAVRQGKMWVLQATRDGNSERQIP